MIRVEREDSYEDHKGANGFYLSPGGELRLFYADDNGDEDIALYASGHWQSVRKQPIADEEWPKEDGDVDQ